ncbi:hypothetical protein N7449_006809 [Penicillium cf. viridicatum]|uniref:Uncharacterized protein n=1 Tax=Penicillium cf. viridicatum TaxID=2972119 RepID=A0A9W9MBG9_9EURO|nr:hypothetical protein N7449_006809 [Penicillium cf. viridicatum]
MALWSCNSVLDYSWDYIELDTYTESHSEHFRKDGMVSTYVLNIISCLSKTWFAIIASVYRWRL